MSKNVKTDPDPTKNVMELVKETSARLDDLRDAETRRVNERIDDGMEHMAQLMSQSKSYEELLRVAEAKRIDANRAGDINAVGVANERTIAQATVLANQVAASAEALRVLVATTAATTSATTAASLATLAKQIEQQSTLFTDRLSALEKNQYIGVGKERYSDPQLSDLVLQVKKLSEAKATSTGRSSGMDKLWGQILSQLLL